MCSGEQTEQACSVIATYMQVKPTSASSISQTENECELPGYKSTSFLPWRNSLCSSDELEELTKKQRGVLRWHRAEGRLAMTSLFPELGFIHQCIVSIHMKVFSLHTLVF